MEIIKLDEKSPYIEYYYDYLDKIFYFFAEYLPPKFFHDEIIHNGELLYLPKFITKRYFDQLEPIVQDFMYDLDDAIQLSKTT